MSNFLARFFNPLAKQIHTIDSKNLWRFDPQVESFIEDYKVKKSDASILLDGLESRNPDVVLFCARLYHELGQSEAPLIEALLKVLQSGRTSLREAALGHLSRLELSPAVGRRLLPYVPVCFYDGLPAELFGAIVAVNGPKDEFVEAIAKHWFTLTRHFFSANYGLQSKKSWIMERVWELSNEVEPSQASMYLKARVAILRPDLLESAI